MTTMTTRSVRAAVVVLLCCCCVVQDALSVEKTGVVRGELKKAESISSTMVREQQEQEQEQQQEQEQEQEQQSSEYPHLKMVAGMFWSMWEEVNENQYGKLGTRAMRNTMTDILTSSAFWDMLETVVKRNTKVTSNKARADVKVKTCNMVTKALTTSPIMPAGMLKSLANDVFEAADQIELKPLEDTLLMVTEAVNTGEMSTCLDDIKKKVDSVHFDVSFLKNSFGKIKRMLFLGSVINVSDGMATKINRISSKFSGKNITPPSQTSGLKLQKTLSAS